MRKRVFTVFALSCWYFLWLPFCAFGNAADSLEIVPSKCHFLWTLKSTLEMPRVVMHSLIINQGSIFLPIGSFLKPPLSLTSNYSKVPKQHLWTFWPDNKVYYFRGLFSFKNKKCLFFTICRLRKVAWIYSSVIKSWKRRGSWGSLKEDFLPS